MTFDPTQIRNFLLVLTAFGGALIVWTYRDIHNRHRDRLVHMLAAVLVALLNLPGVLVYLVLRPPHTLEEEYERTLEEEALLTAIEDQSLCPGCERRVAEDWMICPNCQTKLKKPCPSCGRLIELPWNICPYCATPAPGMRREGATLEDVIQKLPVEESHEKKHSKKS
jgi:RNA polymerase subunit RPABC4/transcription elongation factor Spt4